DHGWDGEFVVMFAGAMEPGHNLGMLMNVAPALAGMRDLVIVLVGDGSAKAALIHESKRRRLTNVEFVTRLPKDAAQRVMTAADLHLVTLVPGLLGCGAPSKAYG